MKTNERPLSPPEPTPVDDVRAVRERLSREAGNDVHKLAEKAEEVVRRLSENLGLKRVTSIETRLR